MHNVLGPTHSYHHFQTQSTSMIILDINVSRVYCIVYICLLVITLISLYIYYPQRLVVVTLDFLNSPCINRKKWREEGKLFHVPGSVAGVQHLRLLSPCPPSLSLLSPHLVRMYHHRDSKSIIPSQSPRKKERKKENLWPFPLFPFLQHDLFS